MNKIPKVEGIRITPSAWQKLLFFLHRGNTEVTGFGVSGEDPELIIDFKLVKQNCTVATINMDKDGLAEYVDEMVDQGISPANCFRYWIHTHPGDSTTPSGTDEQQFREFMETQAWVAMIIIGKNHSSYCRIGLTQGPGLIAETDFSVDWSAPCTSVDFDELEAQYQKYVTANVIESRPIGYLSPYQQYSANYDNINWKQGNGYIERDLYWKEEPKKKETESVDGIEKLENSLHSLSDTQWEEFDKLTSDELDFYRDEFQQLLEESND